MSSIVSKLVELGHEDMTEELAEGMTVAGVEEDAKLDRMSLVVDRRALIANMLGVLLDVKAELYKSGMYFTKGFSANDALMEIEEPSVDPLDSSIAKCDGDKILVDLEGLREELGSLLATLGTHPTGRMPLGCTEAPETKSDTAQAHIMRVSPHSCRASLKYIDTMASSVVTLRSRGHNDLADELEHEMRAAPSDVTAALERWGPGASLGNMLDDLHIKDNVAEAGVDDIAMVLAGRAIECGLAPQLLDGQLATSSYEVLADWLEREKLIGLNIGTLVSKLRYKVNNLWFGLSDKQRKEASA